MGIPDPRRNIPVAEVCYRAEATPWSVLCGKERTAPYMRSFVVSNVTCPQCALLLDVARANRIPVYCGNLREQVLKALSLAEHGADVWTANADR